MNSKDSKAVIILIILILAVFAVFMRCVHKSGEIEGDIAGPTPTRIVGNGSVTQGPTPQGSAGNLGSKPTPTPLLALNITPMVPEKKPTDGILVGSDVERDSSTGEVIVTPDLLSGLTWAEDGVRSRSDLYVLAAFVAEVYSEQTGIAFEGFPVMEEEYGIFDGPYAYYVDKYGFLHVNIRVAAEGYGNRYITGVVGYYGAELAVYDVEVVKE